MLKAILRRLFTKGIIVDTNVFVAANWSSRSSSHRIIDALLEDRLQLVYSPAIRGETELILRKAKTRKQFREKVGRVFRKGVRVLPKQRVKLVKDDPEDDKYLSCVDSSVAKFIISNDRHLLDLKKFGKAKILTSHRFRHEYL